jgi:ABC-type transport system substrate-binding protein
VPVVNSHPEEVVSMLLTHVTLKPLALVGLVLAAVVLGGGGPVQAQSRQETLVLASSISDYITNDPSRTFEFTSQIIDRATYDTLVTVEPPDISVVRPWLATSLTYSRRCARRESHGPGGHVERIG